MKHCRRPSDEGGSKKRGEPAVKPLHDRSLRVPMLKCMLHNELANVFYDGEYSVSDRV